jgi:hypothetical protein
MVTTVPSGGTIHSYAVRISFIRAESPNPGLRVQTLRLRYRISGRSGMAFAALPAFALNREPRMVHYRAITHGECPHPGSTTSARGRLGARPQAQQPATIQAGHVARSQTTDTLHLQPSRYQTEAGPRCGAHAIS